MTSKELFEEYKEEHPIVYGWDCRRISYESWLEKQVISLRNNVLNNNTNYNLCGRFEPDNKTSNPIKCKCGREEWQHPKQK